MANLVNDNIIKGKWKEIKGEIQKTWGRLTDDELDQTNGDLTSVGGLIQQKYGVAQEEVRNKINDLIASFRRDRDDDKNEDTNATPEAGTPLRDSSRQF